MRRAALLAAVLTTLSLAGCASDVPPALTTRHTAQDSVLALTVDAASKGLAYGDLVILVDNVPYKLGGHMDVSQRLYEVGGKDNPGDVAKLGDIIRVPIAGHASVELRHANGASLQQLDVTVPDRTAPPAPDALLPQRAATGVDRLTVFQWSSTPDVSGVRYQLDYWIASAGANAPHASIPDIEAVSYAIPSDNPLLPSTPYRWQIRAIDGAGNVGPWSAEAEFTTSLG